LPRGGVDLADGTPFEAWWAWPNGVCYICAVTVNDCPYPGDLSECWDINVICSHHQFTQGSGDSKRKYGEGSQTGHHIGMYSAYLTSVFPPADGWYCLDDTGHVGGVPLIAMGTGPPPTTEWCSEMPAGYVHPMVEFREFWGGMSYEAQMALLWLNAIDEDADDWYDISAKDKLAAAKALLASESQLLNREFWKEVNSQTFTDDTHLPDWANEPDTLDRHRYTTSGVSIWADSMHPTWSAN